MFAGSYTGGIPFDTACRSTALLLVCLFVASCSFDTARLDGARCESPSDCASGLCIDGYCYDDQTGFSFDMQRSDPYDSDSGQPDQASDPMVDITDDNDGGDDFGGDSIRRDVTDTVIDLGDVGDEPSCSQPNLCGGCETLSSNPGDPCASARCGYFACDGPDHLTCQEGEVNACGGCSDLAEQVGNPCDECGGMYACDGTDRLLCTGSTANVCGGCGGPDAELGDQCICLNDLTEDAHHWLCEDNQLSCNDGNNDLSSASVLPDTDDDMSVPATASGALVGSDPGDWYAVDVVDKATFGGLYPDVSLNGLTWDHELCAYWRYDDGSTPAIRCESGEVATWEGLPGCCSRRISANDQSVQLRNSEWWTDRLDTRTGANNDNGTLFIHVTGEPGESCEPYQIEYLF